MSSNNTSPEEKTCEKCGWRMEKSRKGDYFIHDTGTPDCPNQTCSVCGQKYEELTAKGRDVHLQRCAALKNVADLLKNPRVPPDRFGADIKDGDISYGVVIRTLEGKDVPAIFWRGQLIYGDDNLKVAGFNITEDFFFVGETWNRDLLAAYIQKKTQAKTTKELLSKLIELNKRFAWHTDERVHTIIAAFILASYIYMQFEQAPRLVIIGLADSGKSTQTDIIVRFSLNPMTSADASKAFIFRQVGEQAGLVALDNIDNLQNEDAKAAFVLIFDTSFERRSVGRADERKGKKMPRTWALYCPMVVNGTDSTWIKGTSRSRSIILIMSKKTGAKLEKLKALPKEEVEQLKHEIRVWALENHKRLGMMELPEVQFENRDADISLPLLAILRDAGKEYFDDGYSFLKKNFDEMHTEDESSQSARTLSALWKVLSGKWLLDKKDEQAIIASELAEELLLNDGIAQENSRYATMRQAESIKVGHVLQTLPFSKRESPQGRARYTFNMRNLARMMKARGFEIGETHSKLLQEALV